MTVEVGTESTCERCKRNPRKPGRKICQSCVDYSRDYRRKRIEEGFCRICYLPHDDSSTACAQCLADQAAEDRPEWMCSSCKNPHLPGKAWCARCQSNDKKRKQERFDQGLCRCGREPRLPDRVLGTLCNLAMLRKSDARTRHALTKKRCRNHPREPLAPNNKYLCAKCVAGRRKGARKKQKTRRESGTCMRCPEKAVNGVLCPHHAELNRKRAKAHRKNRIAKGICLRCPSVATNGHMCAVHAEEHCNRQKGLK